MEREVERALARWLLSGTLRTASVVFLLVVSGCADVDIQGPGWNWDGEFDSAWNTDYAAAEGFSFRAAAMPVISLSGMAGSVEIVGHTDLTEVVVEGVRRVRSDSEADAREHLASLAVDHWTSGGTVFIETVQPKLSHGRSYQVEYRVDVPAGTKVIVRQAAGPVEIRTLSGDVDVGVMAGPVTFRDLTGNVQATAMAGAINASVTLPARGVVDLRSSSGDISLSIPAATSAALRATAVTGRVRAVGLALVDEDPRASVLQGTLADGDGMIHLEAVAGDITVTGR